MKEKIVKALQQLERERNIRILYAIESGSRAWGFPSPDSDWDVRFIYVHPTDWYLSLRNRKDTIDLGVDEDLLDIGGWEWRKTLQLMRKSNVAPFEWMQSPIVYWHDVAFYRQFWEVAPGCFAPVAAIHHYLSMAMKFHEICNSEAPVKLKRWFYGLRTALNCKWIVERKTIPPIVFEETLVLVSDALGKRIRDLMQQKRSVDERFLFEGDAALLQLMQDCIDLAKAERNNLPGAKCDPEQLDKL
ncbi:MAG: nucleotidyltransferase domain-containing protein, partial [Bacteroidota bacterium]